MHTLASLFVTLVFAANALFPKSNLPEVLGIETSGQGVNNGSPTSNFNSGEKIPFSKTARPSLSPRPSGDPSLFQKFINTFGGSDRGSGESTATGSGKPDFRTQIREQVKDTIKQQRLIELDSNLSKFNKKAVFHWNIVLDRLTAILDKIKKNANEQAAKGKDISTVLSAISVAESKIADARAAVAAQSGKTYTVDVTTTQNFGQSASATVQALKTDVKTVESKVRDAVESVKNVHTAIKTLVGTESPKPSATP